MNASSEATRIAQRAVRATPDSIRRRLRGLSDRTITWLFISPAILLLLAVNLFPLLWTIYLSFTNFNANRASRGSEWVGLDNYRSVLTDADIWQSMQLTAQ